MYTIETYRTCFMFRSPQARNIKLYEILGPFEIEVWYFMGGFFLLGALTMSTVFKNDNDEKSIMLFSNSILAMVGAICQQGNKTKTF